MQSSRYIFILLLLLGKDAVAQKESGPFHQVFIAGNSSGINNSENLVAFAKVISEQQMPVTIIYTGDILDEKNKIPSAEDSAFIRKLLGIAKNNSQATVYFIPGDLEWNNSGKDGWKHTKYLEQLVNSIAGREAYLPSSGCPGPEVLNPEDDLEIVLINTQWLIHPKDKPYAPDDDCKALVEDQFNEMLEDVIDEAKNKHLLIVGHHPALSNGRYGGRVPFSQHLSPPIAGTFIASYHQNIGSPKDMASLPYKNFTRTMKSFMEDEGPFIYASAHDFNLQALRYGNACQVISGSLFKKEKSDRSENSIYKANNCGFFSISYFKNGKVMLNGFELDKEGKVTTKNVEVYQSACERDDSGAPLNTRVVPCEHEIPPVHQEQNLKETVGVAIGGKQYKAGPIKRAVLGSLYRSSWTAQIEAPYLNLDTVKGGLTPTGIGGGRQTHSLSLNGADGKSYVFRSVDKDPVKALSRKLRQTFVVDLVRQFTATQNPYGALPAKSLLDATDILHARPELYIMPDNANLGVYRKEFAGMLGMLEEKPKKKSGDRPASFAADDIVRTYDLLRKIYKDHDNSVDEKAFLEARIFDMWIGDWGRHEDNWKWAGYHTDAKTTVYKPIPRDRDHAFSLWNGLLPYLASREWAMPNVESFKKHFSDITSLNYPARHLDRFVLTSLERKDWLEVSKHLQQTFTDSRIDSAIQQFPKEILPLSGNRIGSKLKTRRDELDKAALDYYKILAKKVSVVGSNKAERFEIVRLPHDSVSITVRDIVKNPGDSSTIYYQRRFSAQETKHIHLYGLDGDDVITESGTAGKIHIRIFGGKGNDSITSTAMTGKTKAYEYKNGKNYISNVRTRYTNDKSIVEYNRRPAHYDSYLPLPLVYYTPEDGLAAGLGVIYVFHRFGEDGYFNKMKITDRFSTQGNVQVRLTDEFHHVAGSWDLLLSAEAAQPYPTNYFYGAGNETVRNDSFPKKYYQSHIYGYSFFSGLQRIFWQKSNFTIGFNYFRNNASLVNPTPSEHPIFGLDRLEYVGPSASLDIDFRDNAVIPKRGVRFTAAQSYSYFTNDDDNFGKNSFSLELYQSKIILLPLTLGLKGGFSSSTGHVPYYELNTLGRTTNLKGYSRDRFSGRTAAYFDTQLSAEFGTWKTVIAPLTYGVFGFYDLGRVWVPEESSDKIHAGYGGGIYFTPLFEILTTRLAISFSDEEEKGIIEVGLGVNF